MNTCPNCGKMAGLHGSILQGCMCQYSMQAMREGKDFTISKPWVGLTDEEIGAEVEKELTHYWNGEYIDTTGARDQLTAFSRELEAKLKEKNG